MQVEGMDMLISICGKSGSGKSTIARYLVEKEKGIYLDIDKVGHHALTVPQVQEQLIQTFGPEVVENGKVNRQKLGKIVFNSSQAMDRLTDITWKYMEQEIDQIIEKNNQKTIVLDWILLPKTKYFKTSDYRILVEAPYEVREERAMRRDGITKNDFVLRDQAGPLYQKEDFDMVMDNSSNELNRKWVKVK